MCASQFHVTFLKMDLTCLNFTILVWCFASNRDYYKSTSAAELSIPLKAVSLICCWPYAGLILAFSLLSSQKRALLFHRLPLHRILNYDHGSEVFGFIVLIMYPLTLWAESDYYSEKLNKHVILMCDQVLYSKTSRYRTDFPEKQLTMKNSSRDPHLA